MPGASLYFLLLAVAGQLAHAFLYDGEFTRPNIIFLVADDLGFSDVGFRNGDILSPNIDQMARDGVILNSSYIQPSCSPSRAAILTGRYPYKLGIQEPLATVSKQCLPLNETLLPERLQKLGYKTHAIGKWHLGFCNWACTPTRRGFDTFYGIYAGVGDKYTHQLKSRLNSNGGFDFRDGEREVHFPTNTSYSGELYGERAIRVIQTHNATDPFFMWLSFQNVHTPVQVPDKYSLMYPGQPKDMAAYYGMVTIMDEYIGKIISTLKDRNMYDNTLIIFTSDNGGVIRVGSSNWPLRGEKQTLFEGGTRGVTFVAGPILKKRGYINNGMFHAIDWTPTLMHFAEGTTQSDKYLDGIDQFDMINSGADSKRTEFIYKLTESSAIRVGDYKLIWGSPGAYAGYSYKPSDPNNNRQAVQLANMSNSVIMRRNATNSSRQTDSDQVLSEKLVWLFNLKDDPSEEKDLSDDKPFLVSQLKAKIDAARPEYVKQVRLADPAANPANFGNFWSPGWC